MFKLGQQICYPGKSGSANEDIVGWGKDYCFVMDGASCLSGINVVDSGSDAAWMVGQIKSALCNRLDQGDPRPTGEILMEILPEIRAVYLSALASRGMQQPDDSPSAGMALFRKRQGRLEFFGLGDCVGIATLPDGMFLSMDTNLIGLDSAAREVMIQLCKKTGATMLEAKEQCTDLLLKNRLKRNRPGGYWILDLLSDAGIANAREFSWEISEPVQVGALSDGFAQLTEVFGLYKSYEGLFEAMRVEDLEAMFIQLSKMQDADPDCNQYPRFKLRDDTSALWGTFQ